MPGECRQTRHRTHRIAAASRSLHTVIDANRRGLDLPVVTCEILDVNGADAANRSNTLRIKRVCTFFEAVIAERVALDVVAIEPALAHQNMHYAQRKRRVGTGHQRDVLMTLLRCQ